MTINEFVKVYGVEPTHICDKDIISMIYLGCIFVTSEPNTSNEFGVAVFPLPGQRFPDDATLGKAVLAKLELHNVTDDGAYVYLFDPANEEQARTAIKLAGLDRCSVANPNFPGLIACQDEG